MLALCRSSNTKSFCYMYRSMCWCRETSRSICNHVLHGVTLCRFYIMFFSYYTTTNISPWL